MVISHEYRFIYFAPRKTGSTSIYVTLNEKFGAEEVEKRRHEMVLPKKFEDYVTFMSVRNPYSRFLSLYNFFYGKSDHSGCHYDTIEKRSGVLGKDEEWRYKSMYDEFHTPPRKGCVPIRVDHLVHLETLDRDFNQLPFVTDRVDMPHFTMSIKRECRLHGLVHQRVRRFYAKDFEFFGYDSDYLPWENSMSMPKEHL